MANFTNLLIWSSSFIFFDHFYCNIVKILLNIGQFLMCFDINLYWSRRGIFIGYQPISKLKISVNRSKKADSKSCNFCICLFAIYWPIGSSVLVLKFFWNFCVISFISHPINELAKPKSQTPSRSTCSRVFLFLPIDLWDMRTHCLISKWSNFCFSPPPRSLGMEARFSFVSQWEYNIIWSVRGWPMGIQYENVLYTPK